MCWAGSNQKISAMRCGTPGIWGKYLSKHWSPQWSQRQRRSEISVVLHLEQLCSFSSSPLKSCLAIHLHEVFSSFKAGVPGYRHYGNSKAPCTGLWTLLCVKPKALPFLGWFSNHGGTQGCSQSFRPGVPELSVWSGTRVAQSSREHDFLGGCRGNLANH